MKKKNILNLDINSMQPIKKKTIKLIVKTIKLEGSSYLDNFLGKKINKILEKSKKKIANKFKTKKKNIIFTNGATCGIKNFINVIAKKKNTIISSPLEHNSVTDELIKKKKKIKLFFFKKKENNNLIIKKKNIRKNKIYFYFSNKSRNRGDYKYK